ncbi:MAG: hypothetical protein II336_17695 [Loktanella sp.]|nr:hypothetical protein [Loktanella sp.]
MIMGVNGGQEAEPCQTRNPRSDFPLERLSGDASKTTDAKNEFAKLLFQNVTKEVAQSIDSIRRYSVRAAAQARAFAILPPDPANGPVYSEIRSYRREQAAKADNELPATLSQMVCADIGVAQAISAGPGFLSGVGDDRKLRFATDALEVFAPDNMAHMQHAVAVGREGDKMLAGLGKLEQAMFTSALADRASYSRVDVNAPLTPAAAE